MLASFLLLALLAVLAGFEGIASVIAGVDSGKLAMAIALFVIAYLLEMLRSYTSVRMAAEETFDSMSRMKLPFGALMSTTKVMGKGLVAAFKLSHLVMKSVAALLGAILLVAYRFVQVPDHYIASSYAILLALSLFCGWGFIKQLRKARVVLCINAMVFMLSWIAMAFSWSYLAAAVGLALTPVQAFFIYPLITVFELAPFLWEGLGAMELVGVACLWIMRASMAQALVFMLAYRILKTASGLRKHTLKFVKR